MRKLTILSFAAAVCLSVGLAAPSAAWAAEARVLTIADLAALGGTDFDGGPGDYLLRNDMIEATILGIAATPDFDIPIVAEALPGRGVIVDLGTVGDKNDQLTEIDHVVNIAANPIFYGGAAENLPAPVFVTGGPTASITVTGVVLLPPSVVPPFPGSSFSFPTLLATTTSSVTDGEPWVDIETTVTNHYPAAAPVFSIGDTDILAGRSRIPFQPMEDRGHKPPLLDLSAPETALGVWSFLSLPGNNGPEDGPANNDGSPSGKVTYTFVPESVGAPLVGVADQNVAVVGNFFNLASPGGIPPVTAAPANTLSFRRKLVVTNDNTVESGLDVALPLLFTPVFGADLRATFNGKVVDGNGVGIPDAHIFVDNTVPGAPDLSPLVSVLDENLDGSPDGFANADGTDPLPFSHTLTAADGSFSLKLQALADPGVTASLYTLTVNAESRGTGSAGPLSVDPGTLAAGTNVIPDIVLSDTGSVVYSVTDSATALPTPAKLTFVGAGGTPDPDFGNQFLTRRDFSLIQPNGPFPLPVGNSGALSNATGGTPALNFQTDADGVGTIELPPGSYIVFASRGLEYSIDAQPITVTSGGVSNLSLAIERVVDTSGFISMDFHVHSGKSFDSSLPLVDRVASFLAEGVDVMVSTDHDFVTDYSDQISSLEAGDEINSIVGNELTGGIPVPTDATQGGVVFFPEGIGHWNAWPLSVITNNRRNGAPPDEFITPGTAIDRLRGMDSLAFLGVTPDTADIPQWLPAIQAGQAGTPGELLPPDDEVVMFNHPRAGFAGTVVIGMFNGLANPGGNPSVGGYDPTQPLSAFPNVGLFTPSLYNKVVIESPAGTDTNALSFDAIELMNGGDVGGGYLAVRKDWCSLMKQGVHRTATAVSDSHRLVMEHAGFGRSYVASSSDDPAAIDEDELTANVKAMNLSGTSGPFIRFSVEDDANADREMGETAVSTGDKVVVKVRVEAAPWIPVEEVRVYRNCELIETRAIQSSKVSGKVLRFNRALPIEGIDADSFITVEASVRIDGDGDPVTPGLLDTVQAIEPGVVPLGFTNPVFVDRDGNGYVPPGL
jgi:hypothetical protein